MRSLIIVIKTIFAKERGCIQATCISPFNKLSYQGNIATTHAVVEIFHRDDFINEIRKCENFFVDHFARFVFKILCTEKAPEIGGISCIDESNLHRDNVFIGVFRIVFESANEKAIAGDFIDSVAIRAGAHDIFN